jgi:hypothetical protein
MSRSSDFMCKTPLGRGESFDLMIKLSAGGSMFAATFAIAFLAAAGVFLASARTVSTLTSTAAVGFLNLLNVCDVSHNLFSF